ncbi:DUF1192 domain-containing protein [Methylocystis heyeri]|uniref:DUF1192 family protein n=1 Tax=Methylocystis heyeri TaxID=391905 RepID=A0A6B8KCE0_9HYPH|nr:DUF1192 domain-containing protein [Methylocystis heyeri]QGM45886.1 DUF1192 family protein [Methylocystis heyeri]
MAEDPDDKPRPAPTHALGQPLETLSLREIDERIEALRAEIARLEAAREAKQAASAAAEAFFKR